MAAATSGTHVLRMAATGVRPDTCWARKPCTDQADGKSVDSPDMARLSAELRQVQKEMDNLRAATEEALAKASSVKDVSGVQQLVADRIGMEVAAASGRLRAVHEKTRLQLEGKLEELQGLLKAVDTDQSRRIKELQEKQEDAERKLIEVEPRFQKARSEWTAELKSARRAVDRHLQAASKRVDDERAALEKMLVAECQRVSDSQKLRAAELHKLHTSLQALVSQIETESKKRDAALQAQHEELPPQLEANARGVELLQQRCIALEDDMQAQKAESAQACGETEKQLTDLRGEIANIDALVNKTGQDSRRLHNQAIARVHDVEELAKTMNAQVEDAVRTVGARHEETFRAASARICRQEKRVDELSEKLDDQLSAHAEELEAVSQQAHKTCSSLRHKFEHQLELLRGETSEQVARLRNHVDGLSRMCAELATSRDQLQLTVSQEAASLRQELAQQGAKLSSDIEAAREASAGEATALSRRACLIEDRLDVEAQRSGEEIAGVLNTQCTRAEETHERLEERLREMSASTERRLQACADEAMQRTAALEERLAALRDGGVATQTSSNLFLDAAMGAADAAREEAIAARALAAQANDVARAAAARADEFEGAIASTQAAEETRIATGALTAGLLRVAQCCGIIGEQEENPCHSLDSAADLSHTCSASAGLAKLLEWERSGIPLAARLECNWQARLGGSRCRTLLGFFSRKADVSDLRTLQVAVRGLHATVRQSCENPSVVHLPGRSAWAEAAVPPVHDARASMACSYVAASGSQQQQRQMIVIHGRQSPAEAIADESKPSAATSPDGDINNGPMFQLPVAWPGVVRTACDRRLRELFELCDVNGDNRLQKRELLAQCRASSSFADLIGVPRYLQFANAEGSTDALEVWCKELDILGRKGISWLEFQEWACRKRAQTEEEEAAALRRRGGAVEEADVEKPPHVRCISASTTASTTALCQDGGNSCSELASVSVGSQDQLSHPSRGSSTPRRSGDASTCRGAPGRSGGSSCAAPRPFQPVPPASPPPRPASGGAGSRGAPYRGSRLQQQGLAWSRSARAPEMARQEGDAAATEDGAVLATCHTHIGRSDLQVP